MKNITLFLNFLYFRFFYSNVQWVYKSLPMLGFKPQISGFRSDRSTTDDQQLTM